MLLETERLIVRKFSENDRSDLHEYLSLEQALKYEPGGVISEEGCKNIAKERAEGDCFWAVS